MDISASAKDNKGLTPLYYVSSYSFTNDCKMTVKSLLDHYADLEAKCNIGNTLLYQATSFGYAESVQFLLSKGANIHAENNRSNTPLHSASFYFKVDNARMLLDNGADL